MYTRIAGRSVARKGPELEAGMERGEEGTEDPFPSFHPARPEVVLRLRGSEC